MTQEAPVQTMLRCSQCGRSFAQSDLVQIAGRLVCSECKSAFLSRVVAGGPDAGGTRWHYGGFWIRLLAVFIDGIALDIVAIPIWLFVVGRAMNPLAVGRPDPAAITGAMLSMNFAFMLLAATYEVTMIRYLGATLGKLAVGVKVIRTDGSNVGWGVSIGRYFMKFVSGLILAIGYIMAGFDDEKRALHDRVCDTRVIYKRGAA